MRPADRVVEALRSGERYVFAGIPEGAFDLESTERGRHNELLNAIQKGIVPENHD